MSMSPGQQTIPEVLFAAADAHGPAAAIVADSRIISYIALLDRALPAAAVLQRRGIGKGDRVAVWLPNSAEWIEAALGITLIGAVIVPISTRLKAQEAAYMLRKAGARAVLAPQSFLGVDYLAMLDGQELPELAVRLQTDFKGGGEWDSALAAVDASAKSAARVAARAVAPDDVAEIIFTSGTTGFPKGVMLRHRQIVRVYSLWADGTGLTAGDRYLIIAPMFHSFGFKAGVVASILKGATMYPVQTFDAPKALEMIEAEKITVMGGPPTIFSSLLDLNKTAGRDISSLRSVATGANMVSPQLIKALQQDVGVDIVVNAYGLTESSALVAMSRQDDPVELIATTAGRAIDGVEIRCADELDRPLPIGEAGEIQVRGHNVMSGYFEDAEETHKAFTVDGWLKTGDIGSLDEAGYLRIADRLKDMFIVGGFNCYPAEIEKLMLAYPGLREVAVIGVADDRMGEVGKAFVVPRDASTFDTGDFTAWCRKTMANYKVPRFVEVIEALPRNSMGKVQKFQLR
ncbi:MULTISPECIES: AMP-binding protein [unclassified Chelatococcus]|uniref:AMP-binding protein n=1 Tax=unclassified Chelatococcus TaxID=2638111 RepID=UPI001BCE4A7D|nr:MULTISPECIES: AMP-binding protein [unclassified Chelatococcus]MBS7701217.1 AMP-binding protein [Chelatococcus sp. YT9]MBX3557348.1 AMP-binding protein [Chelatococcus sp.]